MYCKRRQGRTARFSFNAVRLSSELCCSERTHTRRLKHLASDNRRVLLRICSRRSSTYTEKSAQKAQRKQAWLKSQPRGVTLPSQHVGLSIENYAHVFPIKHKMPCLIPSNTYIGSAWIIGLNIQKKNRRAKARASITTGDTAKQPSGACSSNRSRKRRYRQAYECSPPSPMPPAKRNPLPLVLLVRNRVGELMALHICVAGKGARDESDA